MKPGVASIVTRNYPALLLFLLLLLAVTPVMAVSEGSGRTSQIRTLGMPAQQVSLALVRSTDTSAYVPSSPDPAGVTLLPGGDRLLISDSEVNEMPIFAQANYFETALDGTLIQTGNSLAYSNEPTGLDVDTSTGELIVADDDFDRIYIVDSGTDAQFGTGDDILVRAFNPGGFGAFDAEGVAYDSWNHALFIANGATNTIYRVDAGANGIFDGAAPVGDDTATSFSVFPYGIIAPDGIAFDYDRGTLFVVGTPGDLMLELTTDGQLVQQHDISMANALDPSGLAYGPSSANPNERSIYIVEGGVDNDVDPTENDGMLFEFAVSVFDPGPPLPVLRTTATSAYAPPSPDPSGVTLLAGGQRLLLTDSEVNETPLYAGANYFETGLDGALLRTGNALLYSAEPTGVDLDTTTGELLVTDDDLRLVFIIGAGADGHFGTPDDAVRSFSTVAFGGGDPEGIAYDSWNRALFIADGMANTVFRLDAGANGIFDGIAPGGDDNLSSFPTGPLNAREPQGIAFNYDTGTLYLVGRFERTVSEITTDGQLVDRLNFATANVISASGLAYGPTSTDPTGRSIYMTDRGIDNDVDPNENDGLLVELEIIPGTPPTPVTIGFEPTDDTFVRYKEPDKNFGDEDKLKVEYKSDDSQTSFLRFDVRGIDGTVQRATLRLFSREDSSDAGGLYLTRNDWDEDTLTWYVAPPLGAQLYDSIGRSRNDRWLSVDVTSAISGDGVISFAIAADDDNKGEFHSREKNGREPQLIIEYLPGPTPPPTPTPPTPVTLYSEATDDTYVRDNEPDDNFGDKDEMKVEFKPGDSKTSFLQFDVSGINGTVQRATLRLFSREDTPDAGGLYLTRNNWDEDTLTWYLAPPLGTKLYDTIGPAIDDRWMSIDLTSVITHDGVYSFVIAADDDNKAKFHTREKDDREPELIIEYVPGPIPPPPPPPPTPVTIYSEATDDAYVRDKEPDDNFGDEDKMKVEFKPGDSRVSYLRFDVSGINGTVQRATLRLFSKEDTPDAGGLFLTGGTWNEDTLTWNNAPPFGVQLYDSIGPSINDRWMSIDVTAAVTGNGVVSFAIVADDGNKSEFHTHEKSGREPELIIDYVP